LEKGAEDKQGQLVGKLLELEAGELLGCGVHERDEAQLVHHEELISGKQELQLDCMRREGGRKSCERKGGRTAPAEVGKQRVSKPSKTSSKSRPRLTRSSIGDGPNGLSGNGDAKRRESFPLEEWRRMTAEQGRPKM
jgi:hypothetical protein